MNDKLQNGDVSSVIGLLNSHAIPQDDELINLIAIFISVHNGDVNVIYCYINDSTGSESKDRNSIVYIKNMKFLPHIYLMKSNELPDGVGIDDMLDASALDQYVNMEYIN